MQRNPRAGCRPPVRPPALQSSTYLSDWTGSSGISSSTEFPSRSVRFPKSPVLLAADTPPPPKGESHRRPGAPPALAARWTPHRPHQSEAASQGMQRGRRTPLTCAGPVAAAAVAACTRQEPPRRGESGRISWGSQTSSAPPLTGHASSYPESLPSLQAEKAAARHLGAPSHPTRRWRRSGKLRRLLREGAAAGFRVMAGWRERGYPQLLRLGWVTGKGRCVQKVWQWLKELSFFTI